MSKGRAAASVCWGQGASNMRDRKMEKNTVDKAKLPGARDREP